MTQTQCSNCVLVQMYVGFQHPVANIPTKSANCRAWNSTHTTQAQFVLPEGERELEFQTLLPKRQRNLKNVPSIEHRGEKSCRRKSAEWTKIVRAESVNISLDDTEPKCTHIKQYATTDIPQWLNFTIYTVISQHKCVSLEELTKKI